MSKKGLSCRVRGHKAFWASALLICSTAGLFANEVEWDGDTDSDWNTAANWNPNELPNNTLPASANIFLDGANVTMSGPANIRTLYVSGDGASAPVLNITQDINCYYAGIQVGSHKTETGYGGNIVHTSGTVVLGVISAGKGRLRVAAAHDSGASNSGSYTFGGQQGSAPVLTILDSLQIGQRPNELGIFRMTGYGTITVGAKASLGLYNGNGTLRVEGGGLSIQFDTFDMAPYGGGSSKLIAYIDNTGFSTINVTGAVKLDNGGGGTNVVFSLEVSDDLRIPIGHTITVIDAGSAFTGDAVFSNIAHNGTITVSVPRGDFTFRAEYENTTDFTFKLVATEVPRDRGGAIFVIE